MAISTALVVMSGKTEDFCGKKILSFLKKQLKTRFRILARL